MCRPLLHLLLLLLPPVAAQVGWGVVPPVPTGPQGTAHTPSSIGMSPLVLHPARHLYLSQPWVAALTRSWTPRVTAASHLWLLAL